MTDNIDNIIGFSAFSLLIVSLAVDTFCSLTWNRMYYTSGLILFVKRIPVNYWHTNIPDQSQLETMFRADWFPSFTFKEFDGLLYGFHEKRYQFRLISYAPLMHGLLTFDASDRQVVVKGFANLYPVAFGLMWWGVLVSIFLLNWSSESMAFDLLIILVGAGVFFILLIGLLYWVQSSRFSRVASYAAEAWVRKYVRESDRA